MKRFLAISFLAIYILSATECNQLLKFPVLFEHFTEHKELNNKISFFDFLNMHYTGHDFNDNDQDRDMQLPFKSPTFAVLDIAAFTHGGSAIILKPVISAKDKLVFSQDVNFQSSYLSSIWQPPKLG